MTAPPGSGPPSSAPPTGTVTFLFSDVEGSTRRWEGDSSAMAVALRRHDALVRAAIVAHRGFVFKTVGDAFCAAFATPHDAVAAALDAQRALHAEDFSAVDGMLVRMALHVGTADERDGDYFGPTVNRVARLLAIGHGGQVLVSGAASELLDGAMPPHAGLRDLGTHRLKDLARVENVSQLVASDLPDVFPALRSLDGFPSNLPPQLGSFVGRESDVAAIEALLRTQRLVTLSGAGGAGKTRCAIYVGAELLSTFDGGVWLVELAPISNAAGAIAQALGVREAADHPLLETLVSYLKRQRLLLVLDNCEHVIEEIRTIVSAILRGAPGVRVLATSREGLAIAGEAVYRLPSLAVPPLRKGAIAARDVRDYGAVALFCDRAFGADRRFTLTDANAPFVAEICRRLDGIPLAIELAAARVNVLSPKDLAAKLDERFRLLAGGDRRALPRQRTMRALIDWSYDLLAEPERRAFRQLSIFADSFTLEMASAVAAGEGDDAIAVLDRLASLVDKSLVANEPGHALTRFRLSESTRQYAREKLVDCGEDVAAAGAHAAVMLDLAERLEREYDELPDGVWLASVQAELENWRAALGWALTARGDILLGQRLAGSLRRAWTFLAAAEGRRWIRAALDQVAAATPPATVAPLELGEAQLDATLGQHKAALAAAGRALARYRELGDALGVAGAQGTAGRALVAMGQIADGEALLDEALPAARTHKARKLIGGILGSLGFARNQLGDLSGARARYSEAAAIYRESGAAMLEADIVSNLAETEFRGGDAQTALRLVGDAVALERSANRHADSIAFDLCNEAAYLLALERFDEARDRAREALEMSHSVNDEVAVVIALQHLAAIATLRRDRDAASASDDRRRAARLLGYVDATIAALEALREYTEQREYDATLAALRVALGEDDLARLTLDGRTWEDDRAIAEARLLA